ncbi:hypothetical protein T265_12606, partial [Opisthorchis viverrini]
MHESARLGARLLIWDTYGVKAAYRLISRDVCIRLQSELFCCMAETLTVRVAELICLQAFDNRCLRTIARVDWCRRIRNKATRKRAFGCATGTFIEECVQHQEPRWLGHELRMPKHRLPKKVLFSDGDRLIPTAPGWRRWKIWLLIDVSGVLVLSFYPDRLNECVEKEKKLIGQAKQSKTVSIRPPLAPLHRENMNREQGSNRISVTKPNRLSITELTVRGAKPGGPLRVFDPTWMVSSSTPVSDAPLTGGKNPAAPRASSPTKAYRKTSHPDGSEALLPMKKITPQLFITDRRTPNQRIPRPVTKHNHTYPNGIKSDNEDATMLDPANYSALQGALEMLDGACQSTAVDEKYTSETCKECHDTRCFLEEMASEKKAISAFFKGQNQGTHERPNRGIPPETYWPGLRQNEKFRKIVLSDSPDSSSTGRFFSMSSGKSTDNETGVQEFTEHIRGVLRGRVTCLDTNGLDLLTECLHLLGARRITASDALNHNYFDDVLPGNLDLRNLSPEHSIYVNTDSVSKRKNVHTTGRKYLNQPNASNRLNMHASSMDDVRVRSSTFDPEVSSKAESENRSARNSWIDDTDHAHTNSPSDTRALLTDTHDIEHPCVVKDSTAGPNESRKSISEAKGSKSKGRRVKFEVVGYELGSQFNPVTITTPDIFKNDLNLNQKHLTNDMTRPVPHRPSLQRILSNFGNGTAKQSSVSHRSLEREVYIRPSRLSEIADSASG